MKALHLVAHATPGKLAPKLVDGRLLDLLAGRDAMPVPSRTESLELLLTLAEASHELLSGVAGRTTFQFDADREVWECGCEPCGRDVLVSGYRPSPATRIAAHERRMTRRDFLTAQLEMLATIARGRRDGAPESARNRYVSAAERLCAQLSSPTLLGESPSAARSERTIVGPTFGSVSLGAKGRLKMTRPRLVDSEHVERS